MIHDYKTPSMTVFIAVVTSRPTTTVDPIRPVTLHLVGLVHQTVRTEEVGSLLCVAVPVLGAVELVGVPPVSLADADVSRVVVGGSAVCVVLISRILVAVLVALVAHLTIATIDSFREVTLDEVGVVQQLLPVLCVAGHVGSVPSRTVPVLPAVEVVCVPPVLLVSAVHEVAAVFSGCVTSLAVVVALVAHRTLATVGVLLEVATTVDEIINLWCSCSRVIRADLVFSLPVEAMPILPAIVGVWKVPVPKLLAVRHGSTVWRGSRCCLRWLGGTHCLVFAWARPTFNLVPVGAPVHGCVVDPRKSISERFTLFVRNCPLDTVVVEGACFSIRLCEDPIRRSTGSAGHLAFLQAIVMVLGNGWNVIEIWQLFLCGC
jgi:hypothetical protein